MLGLQIVPEWIWVESGMQMRDMLAGGPFMDG